MNLNPSSLAGLFRETISLLQPSAELCRFCGKPHQAGAASAGAGGSPAMPASFRRRVCGACLNGIPWLRTVQCAVCGRGVVCPDCRRRKNAHFICNRSAVQYDNRMRSWLALYKYRGDERLEGLLASMMMPPLYALARQLADRLEEQPRSEGLIGRWLKVRLQQRMPWDAVTYVPISAERAEERGFNQAERLAAGVAARTGMPVAHLLYRKRHTAKQSFKTRGERMEDTKRLFGVIPGSLSSVSLNRQAGGASARTTIRLLLIDDIYTTGSTVEACSAALQEACPHPLEVYTLTWARS